MFNLFNIDGIDSCHFNNSCQLLIQNVLYKMFLIELLYKIFLYDLLDEPLIGELQVVSIETDEV